MSSKKNNLEVPPLGELHLGGTDKIDLDALLCREFSDIDEACEVLPGMMEWVNSKLQACVEKKLICEREAKEAEARAWLDFKANKFEEEYPGVSKTEKGVDKAAVLQPKVMAAYRTLAKYAGWVDRLRNLQISIQMKYDLVRSSEATRRKVFNDPEPIQSGHRPSRRSSRSETSDEEEE